MKKGYCTIAVFCSALILLSNMAYGKQVDGWRESGINRIKEVADLAGQKRPDINCRDNDGRTPLHWAVLSGHESLVELLLSRGADINCQDKEGKTPLDWAETKGLRAIDFQIKLLGALSVGDVRTGTIPSLLPSQKHYLKVYISELLLKYGAK